MAIKNSERHFIYFASFTDPEDGESIVIVKVGDGFSEPWEKKRKILKGLGLNEGLGGYQYIPDVFKPLIKAGIYKFKSIVDFWEHIASQSSDENFKDWINKYLTALEELRIECERFLEKALASQPDIA